jgi:hypothetical protein
LCSNLAGNAFIGGLPAEWGALSALRALDASSNYLTGPLPDSWHQLAALQQLQLASNNLGVRLCVFALTLAMRTGIFCHGCAHVPTVPTTSSCDSVEPLPLLQGAIPPSWAQLPALHQLTLNSNVGICGGAPQWREGAAVHAEATNLGHSCVMVNTSGTFAGVVLGKRR